MGLSAIEIRHSTIGSMIPLFRGAWGVLSNWDSKGWPPGRARVRARGVVNVAETRAAKYLARVRGGADDDDGRARARDWVIGMAD